LTTKRSQDSNSNIYKRCRGVFKWESPDLSHCLALPSI